MRTLLFLLLLVLCAAGPYHYFTAGAEARAQRRAHLIRLAAAAAEVRSLLAEHQPRSAENLDRAIRYLNERESVVQGFVDGLCASLDSPPPSSEAVTQLGREARVDEGLLGPLVAGMAGERGHARRRVLAAVLHALLEFDGLAVLSLHVATSPTRSPWTLPVEMLRLTVAVTGSPTDAVYFAERLIAGSPVDPPGDLAAVTLERMPETEWLRAGTGESPPVRLVLEVDLVVGGRNKS